jgi:ABC-type nitrate/sulfonate/bicarbonate transport system permease component
LADLTMLKKAASRSTDLVIVLATGLIFLGIWELAVRALNFPSVVLPSPSRIALSLWGHAADRHAGQTL